MLTAADLFLQSISLFFVSFLGFVCSRFLDVNTRAFIPVLFYAITPFIFFNAGLNIEMKGIYLALPFLTFLSSSLVCAIYFFFLKYVFRGCFSDKRASLIGYAAGASNSGYFGLPIIIAIFPQRVVEIYLAAIQGMALYEFSIGLYILALGKYTKKQAIFQVLKLPMIYAFLFGLLLNYLDFTLPQVIQVTIQNMQGAYIIFGMLLLGMSLSSIKSLKFDFSFLFSILSAKCIFYPAVIVLIVLLDIHILHTYESDIHKMLILTSMMPPAVNTALFAILYNHHQEESATAVLLGTIVSALYIIAVLHIFMFGQIL